MHLCYNQHTSTHDVLTPETMGETQHTVEAKVHNKNPKIVHQTMPPSDSVQRSAQPKQTVMIRLSPAMEIQIRHTFHRLGHAQIIGHAPKKLLSPANA